MPSSRSISVRLCGVTTADRNFTGMAVTGKSLPVWRGGRIPTIIVKGRIHDWTILIKYWVRAFAIFRGPGALPRFPGQSLSLGLISARTRRKLALRSLALRLIFNYYLRQEGFMNITNPAELGF